MKTAPKKLKFSDAFVALCGMQVGIFIQYRKVEMGFDSFWNERLLFLVIACGLALLLTARAYAFALTLVSGQEFSRAYRIEAATYSPLLLLMTYPLARRIVLTNINYSFKTMLLIVLLLVLTVKAATAIYHLRTSFKGLLKVVTYAFLFILAIGSLWLHSLSLEDKFHGPDEMRAYRETSQERGAYKVSYEYRKLWLNGKLKMDVSIPVGGRLSLGVKPAIREGLNLPDNYAMIATLTVVQCSTSARNSYTKTIRTDYDDEWSYFKDFVNSGESSEFSLILETSMVPLGNELFGKLALFQAATETSLGKSFRPWLPAERVEALKVRLPRVELEQSEDLPNVIYISVDMLRPDHMGLYGYTRDTTPNIDKFAQDNVYFGEAFSTDTWTIPAHMSALSSQYTSTHGINDFATSIKSIRFPTIQRILQEKHYATVAFTDGHALSAKYGFDIGFNDYYEATETNKIPGRTDMSKKTFNKAIQWIDEHSNAPFFIFIHSYEAHHFPFTIEEHVKIYADENYTGFFMASDGDDSSFVRRIHDAEEDDSLVDEKDVQYAVDLYDGGIHVADREFGRFIDYLKENDLYDNTIIILTSDHGESFRNSHNNGKTLKWYHSQPPFIEQIRIPFVIKLPSKDAFQDNIGASISLLDLAPTILDALGIPASEQFQGRSLLPLIRKEMDDFDRPIIAERINAEMGEFTVSIIDDKKKYTYFEKAGDPERAREEYYDLANDPYEERNILRDSEGSKELEKLRALTRQHIDGSIRVREADKAERGAKVDEEHLKQLKALGYLGG